MSVCGALVVDGWWQLDGTVVAVTTDGKIAAAVAAAGVFADGKIDVDVGINKDVVGLPTTTGC